MFVYVLVVCPMSNIKLNSENRACYWSLLRSSIDILISTAESLVLKMEDSDLWRGTMLVMNVSARRLKFVQHKT